MGFVSTAIVAIMIAFALYGIVDLLILKEKHGVGKEFKKGIELIGPLALAIVGIIALVPIIAWVIEKTITPVYQLFGLDPSLAVTTFLAIDMGGFQLANAVAQNADVGLWAGVVYGSMMGATIVFSIPVGLASIKKKDVTAFSRGILYGIASIPFGTFVGGLIMGIPVLTLLVNLILPTVFSILIIVCLFFWSRGTIKVFTIFSKFINVISLVGLGLAIVKDFVLVPLDGLGVFVLEDIPVFNILGSAFDGIEVAGAVGLVLAGALPFIFCINKWLKKPLSKLSNKIGFSELGITGFLLSAANNMATFAVLDEMKEREKIINTAFAVSAAFVIGDHLAFTAANAPQVIVPMMVAKLFSGVISIIIAAYFTRGITSQATTIIEE